jgi:hypothetical protein
MAIPFAVVAGALAVAGVASASYKYSYRDGPLTATFSVSTNHPNCKQLWPVTVTASYNGKPARATAYYQFLYNNQLVGTQYPFSSTRRNPHNHKWSFYGSFYDNTFGPFGARAVGYTLYVRAVVQVGRYTAYPGDKSVRVVKTSGCRP